MKNVVNRAALAVNGAEASADACFYALCGGQMAIERMGRLDPPVTDEDLQTRFDECMALVTELRSQLKLLHTEAEAKRIVLNWPEPSSESGGGPKGG